MMPSPQAPAAPAEPDAESGQDTESPDTITVPASVLGGQKPKPGDKLSFEVVDVDPDSGDAEVKLAQGGNSNGSSMSDDMAGYNMET